MHANTSCKLIKFEEDISLSSPENERRFKLGHLENVPIYDAAGCFRILVNYNELSLLAFTIQFNYL